MSKVCVRQCKTITQRVMVPANLSANGLDQWRDAQIDQCIAHIVKALNDARLYTAASSCGHGKQSGEIILHNGMKLIVQHPISEQPTAEK